MNIQRHQIAAMNIQYRYFPLKRFLDDTVSCGIKNVELWGGAPHFYLKDLTYRNIVQIRREITSRGLKLICYTPEQCIYPINLAADRRVERRRSLKYFEDQLRAAAELGADKMLVTTGWGYLDNSNRQDAWNYAKDGLFDLAELAKFYGITLALEVLRQDESNLVYNLPTLMKMLKELNHPSVGGMIDTIPMALAGERPKDYLEALGDKLVHVHFIDGTPRGHLAWGDGCLDMAGYLQEFSDYGYQKMLSLEITDGRYYMEPTGSLRQSVKQLFSIVMP